jgi:hypothetical protein
MKQADKKFFRYNIRNILTNLLQAEQHARDMQTISFVKGEGSCYLKHLLFVKGEVEEVINVCSNLNIPTKPFEKLKGEMDRFFERVEMNKYKYRKKDLINLVRRWRKQVESMAPWYQTFNCKCIHSIPYIKSLSYFLAGLVFAYLLQVIAR